MGSQSRLRGTLNQSLTGAPSHSGINGQESFGIDEEHREGAYLWGTNFDMLEVQDKIRSFIQTYNVGSL